MPVKVTTACSDRLTSNLVVPNENTSGIQVSTDDVGVDLNNFTIRGPVVCSGAPLACTPSTGTGSGVVSTLSTLSGISVRNGSIRGMGSRGAFLGVQAEVIHVRARSNRLDGIYVFTGSTVSGNTVYQNGGNGISAGSGSTSSGNTAHRNGGHGISAGTGSTSSGNTAYLNGGDGIQASSGSTVLGNTVRSNTGFGLSLASQSGYRENVITNNTAGTVNGASLVNPGDNTCNGSLVCP